VTIFFIEINSIYGKIFYVNIDKLRHSSEWGRQFYVTKNKKYNRHRPEKINRRRRRRNRIVARIIDSTYKNEILENQICEFDNPNSTLDL